MDQLPEYETLYQTAEPESDGNTFVKKEKRDITPRLTEHLFGAAKEFSMIILQLLYSFLVYTAE